MKALSLIHPRIGGALGLILIGLAGLHPARAQDATKNLILQNKTDQEEVRLHTSAVADQIQSLVDELTANGISGDDIKVLDSTKAALSNLSGPEMEQVIASLQKAGEAPASADGQKSAVDAYAGQKGIILQLHQILQDYEQRQAAYVLPGRFKELSDRQTDTMLNSASVARATAGKTAGELTGMQKITEQIVQTDQQSIADDVKLAEDQLNKAAQGPAADNDAIQQAQKDVQSGALQQALNQAGDDLKAGLLLKAINEQQTARNELKQIAQDLAPPANAVDALAANAATLGQLIAEQKKLLDQTNQAVGVKPPTTGLADKQTALVDKANSLQQDMQTLSPATAGLVNAALNPMQASRSALATPTNPNALKDAADQQQQALDQLGQAQAQLKQQVADAQKAAAEAGTNQVAKLQDLQKQIQGVMQQQQKLSGQAPQANTTGTNTPANMSASVQQNQLQQKTSDLQQASQPLSLAASLALAKAAQQMKQAQQALNDPAKAADAQAAQQAAQAALTQAAQQVGKQIAQAQQKPPDAAALAAAKQSLQEAQTHVSAAITDAHPDADGKPDADDHHSGADHHADMAGASAALASAAKEVQTAAATPGLPGSAAAAVQQAQSALAQGQQQAAKNDAPGTAKSAFTAEQALAQAQAALAMAQAGLASTPETTAAPPGEPPLLNHNSPSSHPANGLTSGSTQEGTLHDVTGNGKFVTVASRDRAVIEQTQEEKRPQEYGPQIDQYLKNLADQSSSSSP